MLCADPITVICLVTPTVTNPITEMEIAPWVRVWNKSICTFYILVPVKRNLKRYLIKLWGALKCSHVTSEMI